MKPHYTDQNGTSRPIRPELLEILCCPECKADLHQGSSVLFCNACAMHYPIVNGIPIFVDVDSMEKEKQVLKGFYEDFGWKEDSESGMYNSPIAFGFSSEALVHHRKLVNRAQKRHFDPEGKYFLDCASGAIPAEEYLEYSQGYDFHVCVDLAYSALCGAQEKLGDRGLFVNADATKLPFISDSFDAILSSHTIYHIPENQQEIAIREFGRVLKKGKKCVVYYNVGEHSLIGIVLRPLVWVRRKYLSSHGDAPPIYSYHHRWSWFSGFSDAFSQIQLSVYKLFPNQVIRYLFPTNPISNFLGRAFVNVVRYLERNRALYKISQYVTVVFTK